MGLYDSIRNALFPPQSRSVVPKGIPTISVRTKELGASGTKNFGGFITQDYLSDFHGDKGVDIYEEMRRSDATVNAVLNAMKLPILAAERTIDSSDQKNAKQNEIADFVRVNLFEKLEGGFDGFLREALAYLDFGFYYFEKVYRIKDGRVLLRKLAPRPPSAHYRWMIQSDPSVPGVTQLLDAVQPNDEIQSTIREIPMWKLVLFSNNKEGDNWEGVSILRSAYKHWYFKNILYKIDGIRLERGAGIPVITLPQGSNETDKANAEELGRNLKINEQGYVVLPSPEWKFEMQTAGISDQSAALMESIKHHDRMIVVNILAQFLDLGSSSSGSYALSKDQTDFFTLALRAIAKYIAERLNETVIKEIVDLNFGPQEEYPKLRFGEIGEIDFSEMSTAIKTLIDSGLVEVSPAMKVWAHKTFKLPDVSIEDFEEEEERQPEKPVPEETQPEEEELPEEKPEEQEEETGSRFSLANGNFFRPLTFAEERVAFADIEIVLDREDDEIDALVNDATEKQKEDLLKKIEKVIDADDLEAAMAIGLLSVAGFFSALKERSKAAIEEGKKAAAKEIEVNVPTTSGYTKKVIDSKIELYLAARTDRILAAIKARLLDWMNNDVGKTAILSEAADLFDLLAHQANMEITGRIAMDAFNEGRSIVFESNRVKLHGLQRSEILDKKTCPICLTLDGRVLSSTDPFTKISQIHTNCRGIWVAILKTDTQLPPVKTLPKSVKNRFQTIEGVPQTNAFEQMKQPIIRKGSRLEKAIEEGIVPA